MERSPPSGQPLRQRLVSRSALERLLDQVEASDATDALTLYSKPGSFRDLLPSGQERAVMDPEVLESFVAGLEKSETGSVLFWGRSSVLAVLPPFPVQQDMVVSGSNTSHLRDLMSKEYLVGVVLLRLGRYAVGVFRGHELVSSKTDSRYVKSRHSAGGTSQKRFARVREKQVHELYQKTCSVVRTQLDPYEGELDYVFLGGERFTLQGLLKSCDYLQHLAPKTLGRLLNVREPKRAALEGVIEAVWESRVLSVDWSTLKYT